MNSRIYWKYETDAPLEIVGVMPFLMVHFLKEMTAISDENYINKSDLVEYLDRKGSHGLNKLRTKQPLPRFLSYWQPRLEALGCISVRKGTPVAVEKILERAGQ